MAKVLQYFKGFYIKIYYMIIFLRKNKVHKFVYIIKFSPQ
jgi:hypothetical protein